MPEIVVAELINCPREQVWSVISDPLRALDWVSTAVERQFAAEEVVQKGTVTRHIDKFLGRSIQSTWEIVEFDPPSHIIGRTISAPMAMKYEYHLAETDDGTQIELQVEADPGLGGLFGRLADPLVAQMAKRALQADLSNLKDLCEAGAIG